MKRNIFITLSIIILLCQTVSGNKPGTAGVSFLKIGLVPRAIAMGELGVSVTDDVYSVYLNPAGLIKLRAPELAAVNNSWFQDIHQVSGLYALPTGIGNFGIAINSLRMDDFQGYDASGSKKEYITANDLLASISYARTISVLPSGKNKLSAGITLKYISEKLEKVNGEGGAVDIGLLYEPYSAPASVPLYSLGTWLKDISNMWRYAVVIQNIGQGPSFDKEQTPLPTTLRLGMSYHAKYLILGIESVIPNDNETYFCVGAEYKINRFISLRIGDSSRKFADNTGLCAGFGIGYFPEMPNEIFDRIQFDYAFSGFNTLGQTHRIGLTIAFSELPAMRRRQRKIEEHFNNGVEYYNHGKYNRALSELNKVLQLDPDNKEALEMIRKMEADK